MLRYALLVVVVSNCKPAEEPPRRPSVAVDATSSRPQLGPPVGGVRVTERVAASDSPTAPPMIGGVARAELDASADTPGVQPADTQVLDTGPTAGEIASDVLADGEVGFPVRPEDLPAELIALLAQDVLQSARDEARRLNKSGLESHKKLALDDAKQHYRDALVSFPSFPFARYNLACALALQKRDDEALFHLAVLRHLMDVRRDNVARERLEAARVDADFELLRDDPRFRELTGATGVVVTWVALEPESKKDAQALVKALREARWPARTASTAWPATVPSNTIRVRGGDAIAETAAKAIADVLQAASADASAASWPIEIGAPLPADAPPIVVIVSRGAAELTAAPEGLPRDEPMVANPTPTDPDPADPVPVRPTPLEPVVPTAPPPNDGSPFTSLADALGKRLRAERSITGGVERHQLELKATGFFAWNVIQPDGVRKRRAGRWGGGEKRLSLTYKETTETPSPSDPTAAPGITVVEGLTNDLRIEIGPHGLTLDGLVFQ